MKTIQFARQNSGRKRLAEVIGEVLGAKPVYQGTPSFAYLIGGALLDKDWVVSLPGKAETTSRKILDAAYYAGFKPVSQTPTEEVQVDAAVEGGAVSAPVADTGEPLGLTVALPAERLDAPAVARLEALLAARGPLIAKALGAEHHGVEVVDDRLVFAWFDHIPAPDDAQAATQLVAALCDYAARVHRVTTKPGAVANEKYVMRTFLLRLGFVGDEHKQLRRTLLARLSGDSAWAKPPKTANTPENAEGSQKGRRVRMVCCEDPYTNLEAGAEGTVLFVDAVGTVHIDWDNGSTLGLVKGVDQWQLI
ncbi:DUF4314 domain-containing protein [Actinotignum urinale]|uniref:DUF4314 domain-containing protein n=1 Tax=Actinotignum urinale TaxID=190146 RepID=A0ABU5G8B3_9ACTO|nr:DUF4314 domain-containing protein [Actinotignum urinale]MDY5133427.1 DUF4314 domain-containing protein [Actinotignum urinale]